MTFERIINALTRVEVRKIVKAKRTMPDPGRAITVGVSISNHPLDGVLELSNKLQQVASVTRLVLGLPAEALSAWLGPLDPNDPQALLDATTLVVEDASPDSVLGVVMLLLRLAGWQPDGRAQPWLAAVERWETDGMVTGDPYRAWPSLAAALSHAHFPTAETSTDAQRAQAWTATVRFAAECLKAGYDPAGLPTPILLASQHDATVALRQEDQVYQGWLQHAQIVQLSLPLEKGDRRRILVDSLLFIEDQPTGAAKVLYRTDTANAPLRQGFCLAASYRPGAEIGSGNEFTITVDPDRGVVLDELWRELERRETEAWRRAAMQRPNWQPRADVPTEWNQPWYINPERTLIAAPRSVRDHRISPPRDVPNSSTKLVWQDVLDAVWTAYAPLRDIVVDVESARGPVPLLELDQHAERQHGKLFLFARWPRPNGEATPALRALASAPVVDRALAGLIREPTRQPLGLADLPSPHSWTQAELSGGFAVATQLGLLVFDDWRDTKPIVHAAVASSFALAARLNHELARIEQEQIEPLSRRLDEQTRSRALRVDQAAVLDAATVMAELANLQGLTASVPHDADARCIRQLLNQAWALDHRLAAATTRVKGIADALKALGDAQMRRLTQLVAMVAFPFYVATGLATPLAKLSARRWHLGTLKGTDPTANTLLVWIALLFVAGVVASWLLVSRLSRPKEVEAQEAPRG